MGRPMGAVIAVIGARDGVVAAARTGLRYPHALRHYSNDSSTASRTLMRLNIGLRNEPFGQGSPVLLRKADAA